MAMIANHRAGSQLKMSEWLLSIKKKLFSMLTESVPGCSRLTLLANPTSQVVGLVHKSDVHNFFMSTLYIKNILRG